MTIGNYFASLSLSFHIYKSEVAINIRTGIFQITAEGNRISKEHTAEIGFKKNQQQWTAIPRFSIYTYIQPFPKMNIPDNGSEVQVE